jgi:hypothetical protein
MGSQPTPGAGARAMHRKPKISAFPRLLLPRTSASEALPKIIDPPSNKSPLHRREGLNFKRINEFFVCGFLYTLDTESMAHLCGGVSYGDWRSPVILEINCTMHKSDYV